MITFTPDEQAQIDDMVARIGRGELNRDSFIRTTDMLAGRYKAHMTEERRRELTARQIVETRTRPALTPTTAPVITKRVGEYDPETQQYPAYVAIDGESEQLVGCAWSAGAADRLADDYAFHYYADRHTPEVAATIAVGMSDDNNDGPGPPDNLTTDIALDLLAVCEAINTWLGTDDGAHALPFEPPWYQRFHVVMTQANRLLRTSDQHCPALDFDPGYSAAVVEALYPA